MIFLTRDDALALRLRGLGVALGMACLLCGCDAGGGAGSDVDGGIGGGGGGNCVYEESPGTVAITDVRKVPSGIYSCPDGREVLFDFTPDAAGAFQPMTTPHTCSSSVVRRRR